MSGKRKIRSVVETKYIIVNEFPFKIYPRTRQWDEPKEWCRQMFGPNRFMEWNGLQYVDCQEGRWEVLDGFHFVTSDDAAMFKLVWG